MIRSLVGSELRKVRSTRLWWILLLGAGGASLLFGLVAGAISGEDSTPGAASLGFTVATTVSICALFALIFGIMSMTSEFRYGTVTTSYLTAASRDMLLAAKAIVAASVGAAYGLVIVLTGVPGALLGQGLTGTADLGRLIAVSALGVLVCAAWAAIGVAIGALVRNQLPAVLGALGYVLLIETTLSTALTAARAPAVGHFLPGDVAGAALTALAEDRVTVFGPPGLPPWWLAMLIFLGYLAAAGGIAVLVTRRRDVT